MPRLTDTFIRGFKAEARTDLKDDIVPGLWLRVGAGANGSKTWVFRFRQEGAQRSITLGRFPDMGLKDARLAAEASRKGDNVPAATDRPRPGAAPTVQTFAEVAEDFIASAPFKRNRTADDRAKTIRTGIVPRVGEMPITSFTRSDAKRVIQSYMDENKPSMARRVKVLISQLLTFAADAEVIQFNPAAGMRMPAPVESRDRYLTDDELRDFWLYANTAAAQKDPMRRAIRWIIATGQRRTECLLIHASEVDEQRKQWTLPANRTKNGQIHVLPLTDWHLGLLGKPAANGFYFANPKPQFDTLNPRSLSHHVEDYCNMRNIDPSFTAHDLRRTMTTRLAEMGTPLDDIKRVLNHTFKDVTSRHYDMFAYMPQKLAALEKWRDYLISLEARKPVEPA